MKPNEKFILNKNLDIENENFIVKKGTTALVVRIFDELNPQVPTKICLKFEKINGNYIIEENELTDKSNTKNFKLQNTYKYPIGSKVKHNDYGNGKVIEYVTELISNTYVVEFSEGRKIVDESEISAA